MDNIIEIKNVTHNYKGAAEESLKEVSLFVKKGETLLLCGESGSGKTSVIRLINGLIPHYYKGEMTGEVYVKERDISKTELHELAGIVGTVFQNPRSQFFSVDTDGEIVFGPENIGLEPKEIVRRKSRIISQLELESLLNRSLFELSGGEKQRIACASVAALKPDIILLDEPSSNLDIEAIRKLKSIIELWKEQGKTIIISEHRLWYLKDLADRVIYMRDGKIEKEWTGDDFMRLEVETLAEYKLRPLEIKDDCFLFLNENYKDRADIIAENEKNIKLKDFYFSYDRKIPLLRKRDYSNKDAGYLQLNIPELILPQGKVIAVTGRNGTGKSTFLRSVCGLERRCPGPIEIEEKIYKGNGRLKISYMVMQDVNHQLFTDSVEAEVLLSMKEKDEKRCEEILNIMGLLKYKDKHPMALSGGQKQRVAIASAMAAGAKFLLFDEPTSGLDFSHMEKVAVLLRELSDAGNTVLVSTHDSELIDMCCDYELCIEKGRVAYLSKRGND